MIQSAVNAASGNSLGDIKGFAMLLLARTLGAIFGLIGGGVIFWMIYNPKAVAITAASIFSVALLYLTLLVLQRGVGVQ